MLFEINVLSKPQTAMSCGIFKLLSINAISPVEKLKGAQRLIEMGQDCAKKNI